MKETIEAIYENGVLRLLKKLSVPEGRRIRITLESLTEDGANDSPPSGEARYDFSDLMGRLSWKGNALKEQRRLRNDWS